jgi:Arc/MetJ-type ribon-helix-helix transcriptional regulator
VEKLIKVLKQFLFGFVVGIRGLVKSIMCITLDMKVFEWIERKVDEGVFASRSHAVAYAVRQLMRQERKPENIIS